jgi:hypothetical protein
MIISIIALRNISLWISGQLNPCSCPGRLRFLPVETSDADRLRFQANRDRIRAALKSAYGLVTARTNTN